MMITGVEPPDLPFFGLPFSSGESDYQDVKYTAHPWCSCSHTPYGIQGSREMIRVKR